MRGWGTRRGLLPLWPALLQVAIGCGQSGPAKLPLAGTVELDGQPIAEGSITFTGASAASTGGKIRGGKFSIDQQRGLPPGTYRVDVFAFEPTGRTVPDTDAPGQMIKEKRQVVPAKYNEQSEFTIEIDGHNASRLVISLTR